MLSSPFTKLSLALASALALVLLPATASSASPAASLSTFCAAARSVGPVPTYNPATSSPYQARRYLVSLKRFTARVDHAMTTAALATTITQIQFSLDWDRLAGDLNKYFIPTETLAYSSSMVSTPAKQLPVLEKLISATRADLRTAQLATHTRGCKL